MVDRSSPAYSYFLGQLVEARRNAGLTQRDVAERLDRPQSYVSKCELGERRVDVVELAEFAAVYGRSLDSFVRAVKRSRPA